MRSTRSEFPQNFVGINESTGSNVSIRVSERLMESGAVGIIQPVAGVERKEFDFSAVGETRRFVNDESTRFDRGLDRHGGSVPLDRSPNKARWMTRHFIETLGLDPGDPDWA